MKKFYKYLLLIISLLLSSCKDKTYYFNYGEMIDKVVKIEVVEADSADPLSSTRKFLFTLEKKLIDDFLLDLSKICFVEPFPLIFPGYPEGITFCIYYEDDKYYDYINYRTSLCNNNSYGISIDDYNYLVDKYYYQII
jgi:hypothetical protein